ncbi:MAG: L-2-hydroxyglutarate oxidase [Nitrospira sp.]|nr:L-2-hydroxyglutarate oxidase [Nitrospira sp.]
MEQAEILICGGGIIGLTLARELIARGAENILILEKEEEIGQHASGRNSGVLHAGIYYPAGSLKAKLCLRGNRLMKAYCRSKGLPLRETGKVVVARHEGEVQTLHKLHAMASNNGATVELIDERQLDTYEPFARTHQVALRAADTAMVDPKAILRSLVQDLLATGRVRLLMGTTFDGLKQTRTAETSRGPISYEVFINAAGAYSDTIAHHFGLARQFRLIPFKGTYRELGSAKASLVKGNIYPVPDLRNPFLGVHFTRGIHDHVYVGPTAIPAFGRENYRLFEKLSGESLRILLDDARLFFLNPKFRTVALTEPRKYLARYFFEDAKSLVKSLCPDDLGPCGKVWIRPQLVDWAKKELVMNFLVVKDQESLHILNAISPAFTSSMAFAEYVVDEYLGSTGCGEAAEVRRASAGTALCAPPHS